MLKEQKRALTFPSGRVMLNSKKDISRTALLLSFALSGECSGRSVR